jgi:deoxycytidine triphosphate deaminase
MIRPFAPENLKPANYKLTIGDEYAMDGKIYELSDQPSNRVLTIPPFQVAVIKTSETINMPNFLIARWNIRVQLAYKGLLWVGGPQVDAGYVGHLFCPVYNLSNQPVSLNYGDPIAVIDFVRTSEFHEGTSLAYSPVPPERILFEDYEPQKLNSALFEVATKRLAAVEDRIESTEKKLTNSLRDSHERTDSSLKDVQTRIDTFVLITFTVMALLFAGLTFLTNDKNQPTWNSVLFSTSLTSVLALLMSSMIWLQTKKAAKNFGTTLQFVILLIAIGAVIGANVYQFSKAEPQKQKINDLERRVDYLQNEIAKHTGPDPTGIGPNRIPLQTQPPRN